MSKIEAREWCTPGRVRGSATPARCFRRSTALSAGASGRSAPSVAQAGRPRAADIRAAATAGAALSHDHGLRQPHDQQGRCLPFTHPDRALPDFAATLPSTGGVRRAEGHTTSPTRPGRRAGWEPSAVVPHTGIRAGSDYANLLIVAIGTPTAVVEHRWGAVIVATIDAVERHYSPLAPPLPRAVGK